MFKKVKNFIVVGMAAFLLLVPALAVPGVVGVAAAANNITTGLCTGTTAATGDSDCTGTKTSLNSSIKSIASTVVNTISIIVGVIAVIFIIYGGFKYITSGGDSGKVSEAKNALIYAIVGLLVVAIAQAIVRFVLSAGSAISA